MAARKKAKKEQDGEQQGSVTISKSQEQSVLKLARERWNNALSADKEGRAEAVDDLKFRNLEQWPADLLAKRKAKKRPCLVLDKCNEKIRQVIGDIRQNKIGIKVNPNDENADPDTADVIEGKIRNIEYISNAEIAYDTAGENSTTCGRGWIRVVTKWADALSMDEEIYIERVADPLSVYYDPGAFDWNLVDARFMFVVRSIDKKEEYKDKYKGKIPVDIQSDRFSGATNWISGDNVIIAEYWLKVPDPEKQYTLCQLEDLTVVREDELTAEDESKVIRRREVKEDKVIRYIIDGKQVLEGPKQWPSKYIPLIPVWGEEIVIEGIRHVRGLIRPMKDPQKMHNYWESKLTEVIALAPNAKWVITNKEIDGHEAEWDEAHEDTNPYLTFNSDPHHPKGPQRFDAIPIPAGLEQRSRMNVEHIKSASSTYDASLGARSNEKSGIAIERRQIETDVATYFFPDNLKRAIGHLGRVVVDLIPHIYDSEKKTRIRDADGTTRWVDIGKKGSGGSVVKDPQTGQVTEQVFDLSKGNYDITVEVGPTRTTQRQNAQDKLLSLIEKAPDVLLPLTGDILAKNMDWHGADDLAERLKLLWPEELKQKLAAEAGTSDEQGAAASPEAAHAMMTAYPGGAEEEAALAAGEGEMEQVESPELGNLQVQQEQAKLRKMEAEADAAEHKAETARLEKTIKMKEVGVDPARTAQEVGAGKEAAVV